MQKKLQRTTGMTISFRPTRALEEALNNACKKLNVTRTSIIEASLECFLTEKGCLARKKVKEEMKKFLVNKV